MMATIATPTTVRSRQRRIETERTDSTPTEYVDPSL
jgi:hypothetical protein